MITYSDNRAADAVYAQVGDEGLEEVARRAGMRDFEPTPGFWGGDQVTAADLARFFFRLEANLPGPHRAYAKGLLARITPVERWGIPQAIGHGWSVWFKGGWRPAGAGGHQRPGDPPGGPARPSRRRARWRSRCSPTRRRGT